MIQPGLPWMLVEVLGWSLVHFVWQALVVGGLYALVRVVLPRGNPRYLAAMFALAVLAACPVATAWYLWHVLAAPVNLGNMVVAAGAAAAAGTPGASVASQAGWLEVVNAALPWLVLAWACGVAFIGARTIRHWRWLRATLRTAEVLPAWQARACELGRRLGLRRATRVLASARIATPTLVGWVRPVVVMPLAILAKMPAPQMDLVLAHELAHLRRLDHLANLFQVVVETLLFYHPVLRWVSREARNERELCCDAMALRVAHGTRRDFVAALAGLEEFRVDHPNLALAASGGVLVERAWFIAGNTRARHRTHTRVLAPLLALLVVAVMLAVVASYKRAGDRVHDVLVANAALVQQQIAAIGVGPATLVQVPGAMRVKLAPVPMARVSAPLPESPALPAPVHPVAASVALTGVANLAAGMKLAPAQVAAGTIGSLVPRATFSVPPVYPPEALLAGLDGTVDVGFTLSAAGVPEHVHVVASGPTGSFNAAAVEALSQWRFTPPAVPGKQYRQTFTFRANGGAAPATGATAPQFCRPTTGTHICRDDAAPASTIRVGRLGR